MFFLRPVKPIISPMSTNEYPDTESPIEDLVADSAPKKRKRSGRSPRHIAMDLLARRDHSRLELEEKLTQKLAAKLEAGEISGEDIYLVLDELEQDGLLDDSRFAESFINSRIRRGQGPVRIRRDIDQKGISSALVGRIFEEQDFNWVRLAREVRVKKFGTSAPEDYKERARQARFLQYRGFSGAQIQSALDGSFED